MVQCCFDFSAYTQCVESVGSMEHPNPGWFCGQWTVGSTVFLGNTVASNRRWLPSNGRRSRPMDAKPTECCATPLYPKGGADCWMAPTCPGQEGDTGDVLAITLMDGWTEVSW